MIEPQAIGKRGIEVIGLTGYLHLFVGTHAVERAHIVKAVGKLYEYGTHVELYGSEYLAEVVDLLREVVLFFLLLGDNTDEEGNVITKTTADVVNRYRRILDDIVKEGGNDWIGSQLELLCDDARHGYGMDDIGLARLALLVLMGLGGKSVSIANALKVLVRNTIRHHLQYSLNALVCFMLIVFFHSYVLLIKPYPLRRNPTKRGKGDLTQPFIHRPQ